jgi:hypothetical protein
MIDNELQDLWMLERVLVDGEPPEMDEYIHRTIRWNLSTCPRCLAIYDTLGMVPVKCDQCGERGLAWRNFIDMAARMAMNGQVQYVLQGDHGPEQP